MKPWSDRQSDMLPRALANKPFAPPHRLCRTRTASMPFPLLQTRLARMPASRSSRLTAELRGAIPQTTATTDNVAASALAADKMAETDRRRWAKSARWSHMTKPAATGIDSPRFPEPDRKANYPRYRRSSAFQYWRGRSAANRPKVAKAILNRPTLILAVCSGTNEGSAIGIVNAIPERWPPKVLDDHRLRFRRPQDRRNPRGVDGWR